MRIVYICHPVRGDVETNLALAKRWVRAIEERFPDVAVVANWIYECEIWDDAVDAERNAGIQRNKAVLQRCDEVWLVGDRISSGMQAEARHALSRGVPVYRLWSPNADVTALLELREAG